MKSEGIRLGKGSNQRQPSVSRQEEKVFPGCRDPTWLLNVEESFLNAQQMGWDGEGLW